MVTEPVTVLCCRSVEPELEIPPTAGKTVT